MLYSLLPDRRVNLSQNEVIVQLYRERFSKVFFMAARLNHSAASEVWSGCDGLSVMERVGSVTSWPKF